MKIKIILFLLGVLLLMTACENDHHSILKKELTKQKDMLKDKDSLLEKTISKLDKLAKDAENPVSIDTGSIPSSGSIKRNGKYISVNFEHYPLDKALRKLANFERINLVISKSVQGEVSLSLKMVSWHQAINSLLQSQGLSKMNIDGVMYIAPLEEIAKREQQLNSVQSKAPLKLRFFRLNYAKANDVANLLLNKNQKILSSRGQLAVDVRTNGIMVRDTERQLTEISQFVKKIDIPIKQVLIEARIVNMDSDFERDLGINFGLRANSEYAASSDTSSNKRLGGFNVDLPLLSTGPINGGLAVFRLSKTTLLDLELSALESEGKADIISNPRLVTANQQAATIQSGEEIPYQEQAGAEGSTKTAFKKAVLRLKVTPQITPNDRIVLKLKLNQDKRSTYEVKGVPTIDTRELSTQATLKNGQTIVLGGIYEQTKINGVERVPFFSEVPLIGILFKHKRQIENHRELLIFVTPKIIEGT